MKVSILIEFEVDGCDEEDAVAKEAASLAAYDFLVLTRNGESVVDDVEVHVDGHGTCRVKLGEDHE